METDSIWFAILVIILSVTLLVFLILGIILLRKSLEVVKQIKQITERAEAVADRAEHISAFFEKTSTPVAIMKLISNINETLQKKVKRK